MLTRCPACQTVFRLSAEQLAARAGKVRCGHCFHPFNAPEHELAPVAGATTPAAPGPLPAAQASAAAPLILEDKPALPARALFGPPPQPAADADTNTTSSASALDFDLPERFGPAPAALPEVMRSGRLPPAPPAAVASEAAEDRLAFAYDRERALHPDGRSPAEVLLAARDELALTKAEPGTDGDDESGEDERAGEEPNEGGHETSDEANDDAAGPPAGEEASAARSLPDEPAQAGDFAASLADALEAGKPSADACAPSPAPAHINLSALDARYGRPPAHTRRGSHVFGKLLIGVLSVALAAQLGYLYRGELSRLQPGLRPLLEQACAPFGCEVPRARRASELVLESSDLETEPGKPGHFLLYFSLSNRAPHEQAWPHVELTLTDARDLPIARRVLSPAEWMPATEQQPALASRRNVSARVRFQASELAPTGYRVYLFYP